MNIYPTIYSLEIHILNVYRGIKNLNILFLFFAFYLFNNVLQYEQIINFGIIYFLRAHCCFSMALNGRLKTSQKKSKCQIKHFCIFSATISWCINIYHNFILIFISQSNKPFPCDCGHFCPANAFCCLNQQ